MIEYEYHVVEVDCSTNELNSYLQKGWEVVNTTAQHMGGDNSARGYVFFTLRREKKNDR